MKTHTYSNYGTVITRTASLIFLLMIGSNSSAAFYVNCAACHTTPQSGMEITNYQSTTNAGAGTAAVFSATPGQTVALQLAVTNRYGGTYALNINNLNAPGLVNSSNKLVYTPDPTWTDYFPGTITNFFMAGPTTTSPEGWTFALTLATNTPPDVYLIKAQMAGVYSSTMWSQQAFFYLRVLTPTPPPTTLQFPHLTGNAFSVQAATTNGFTYYLECATNLAAPDWSPVAESTGDGTRKTFTDSAATNSSQFYRVRIE
jgi:hypothetical protein